MKTELKDVIHLYLECEVMLLFNKNKIGKLTGLNKFGVYLITVGEKSETFEFYQFKPILRHLSSMTNEEFRRCREIEEGFQLENNGRFYGGGACMLYLIREGFDLYKLIEYGQAIDKTTLKP